MLKVGDIVRCELHDTQYNKKLIYNKELIQNAIGFVREVGHPSRYGASHSVKVYWPCYRAEYIANIMREADGVYITYAGNRFHVVKDTPEEIKA